MFSKILIISQLSLHLNHLSVCQDLFVSLSEGCETVLVGHREHADQQIAAVAIDLPREATEQHSPQSQAVFISEWLTQQLTLTYNIVINLLYVNSCLGNKIG